MRQGSNRTNSPMESFPPPRALKKLSGALDEVAADEGTVWQLDEAGEALSPVWNSGPRAAEFVGKHRQPLSAGLISLVCVTGQALCENAVYRHVGQDATLDRTLGVLTCAMIAVPWRRDGEVCGVVSCVKLKPSPETPDPSPFTPGDLARVVEVVRHLDTP